jgi:molecular chaperone GrpE
MTKSKPAVNQISSHQLKDLHSKILELTDALKQERADSINLRRQYEDQLTNARTNTRVSVVTELLPVIDNVDRALMHAPKELATSDYVKGVQQVAKQLAKALEDLGVTRIATVGQEFDPRYHEAVMMDEGEGNKEIVSQELLAGYQLGETVIRHAMVKVQPQ